MKFLKHRYDDPTGGGEDATLILPEWADPPAYLAIRIDESRERVEFDLVDDDPVECDEDGAEVD